MIYVNADGGLNGLKIKKFIKTNLKSAKKDISIKNAVKVVKFAAPIAAGFIPLGGGVASKLTSKVLDSKVGKVVSKVAKSKVAKKVVKLSKTQAGKLVVKQAKAVVQPKIQAIQAMTVATFAKTATPTAQAPSPYANENAEPIGELTPVKPTTAVARAVTQTVKEEITEDVEPMGELTPVKPTTTVANEMQNIKVDDSDVKNGVKKDNTMLYVGGAVALGAIAYLATKKSK